MTQQVSKEHYRFDRYASVDRFGSYWYQLKEIYEANPHSVMEVGAGDAVVGNYLRHGSTVTYTSVDYAPDTKPDVVADVLALPFPDNSFDITCAFEVLEHLPYENFDKALSELVRVASKRVIISVPHFGPPIKFLLKLPLLPEIRVAFKIPFAKQHVFNGQHYWEIGKRGYSVRRILKVMRRHGNLVRHYVPFENQYHHFFVLEKRAAL